MGEKGGGEIGDEVAFDFFSSSLTRTLSLILYIDTFGF